MSQPRPHVTAPAAYITLALLLGLGAPELGQRLLPKTLSPLAPQSAIALLSAIAAGMMALTAIAFSIVFVFFQLSSSAYTPRLLGELGSSRLTSHALGIFTGTFVYASLAIRAVGHGGRPQLPALVGWIGLLWLLASVATLSVLIESLSKFSVAQVLAELGARGLRLVCVQYRPFRSEQDTQDAQRLDTMLEDGSPSQVITHEGLPLYLVRIDGARLSAAARAAGGVLVVPYALGEAIMPGDTLALLRGGERRVDAASIRAGLRLERERTIANNPAYALRLLADIAIRALSPAVNDPTTAVAALDQIEALLRAFGAADLDRSSVRDASGTLRVVWAHPSWEDLLELGLCEIAQYGRESLQVQRRLAALLADLSDAVPPARRVAVERWHAGQQALEHAELEPEARVIAAQRDRQGLGHTLPR